MLEVVGYPGQATLKPSLINMEVNMSEKSLKKAEYVSCKAVCLSCVHYIWGDCYCNKHNQPVNKTGFCNSYEWDEETK
jgi:hypothetical protein